jgi:hypothetical protein
MKRRSWLFASGILLVLAMLFTLGGCIWPPGTGTICVRSMLCWDKTITALYIYQEGTPGTPVNRIDSPLEWFDEHLATGLQPGSWTVYAVVDNGPSWAEKAVIVAADHVEVVPFYDQDIH